MAQKKFLVTGATGDTGGYTVEQLVERGHAVRALAHREDDRSKRLGKMGAEVVIGDFLKFNDVRAAMRGFPMSASWNRNRLAAKLGMARGIHC